MNTESRSADVYNAVSFLRDVHRDVGALITSVDRHLDECGWDRTLKNQVSNDLSNGLNPEWWVIQYVARFYAPKDVLVTDRTILLSVVFVPDGHRQSIVFSVGARLDPPARPGDLWAGWRDARRFVRALKTHESGSFDCGILRDGLIPNAASAVAAAVPLFELRDMDVVHERLLRPALDFLQG